MRIKLNVYEKGQVKKVLETESTDIMYGVVEDVLNVVEPDKLDTKLSNDLELAKMVIGVLPLVKPLVLDVFPDCTEDDLRHTKVRELAVTVVDIIKSQISDLNSLLPNNSKN